MAKSKASAEDILSCFPAHLTPRPAQIEALNILEESWKSHDVFVVNLPVAIGKSAISQTLSKWSTKVDTSSAALTLASNNMLVDQYLTAPCARSCPTTSTATFGAAGASTPPT